MTKNRFAILLVGVGEIGKHYLRGMASLSHCIQSIDLVDSAFSEANGRLVEIQKNYFTTPEVRFGFFSSLNELSESGRQKFDLVILATGSLPRFKLFAECLNFECQNYLLEKVVFTKSSEYETALNLIAKNNLNVWVNTSKRYFPAYQKIKEWFHDGKDLSFQAELDAGDIGIGCNSVHFLDLLRFWTLDELTSCEFSIAEVYPAKRLGYKELTGVLTARYASGSLFKFHSNREKKPWKFKIERGFSKYEISNRGKTVDVECVSTAKSVTYDFEEPMQSDISQEFILRLFKNEKIISADLKEIFEIDKIFLPACQNAMSNFLKVPLEACPIT